MTKAAVTISATGELERQVERLTALGYPVGGHVAGLREKIRRIEGRPPDIDAGTLAFVVVVSSALVPADTMMSRVEKDGQQGETKLYPRRPEDFSVIEEISLPAEPVYLLVGIDRGKSTINVPPDQALIRITEADSSPLTIDEGIAIVTQYPDFLVKNNCFSLAASRYAGDKRVPAIWISKSRRPHLGWCWAGNPHTWIGTASCVGRV